MSKITDLRSLDDLLDLGISDGTNGQALTTNGSGTFAFADASAAKLSTASGSAPSYSARAFVTLDGNGTVSVLRSGNVSSITDLGTGNYRVNYTTAMNSSNHCVTLGDSWGDHYLERLSVAVVFSSSTSNCTVGTVLRYTNNGNTKIDSDVMHVVAHDV